MPTPALYLRHLPRATENSSSRRSGRKSCATFSRNSLRQKTFPSQFNPAISLAIDTMFAYRQHEGNNFEFRSAELGLSASVDPFVRGYAFFNGTSDDFEVEEAAIVTTSLPFNLAVKGGRFFADFGRLAKFHDHDLPFVNRPVSVDRFVGGESQADGFEVSYLLPIEHYVTLTAGMYNKLGADNDRVSNEVPRDLGQFTYLGRVATFISLSDAHSMIWARAPIRRKSQAKRRRIGIWPVWTLRTVMSRPRPPTVVSSGVRRCSSIERTVLLAAFQRIRRYQHP